LLVRASPFLIAVPAGLLAGALGWMVLGAHASGAPYRLAAFEARLSAIEARAPRPGAPQADAAPAAAGHPLFSVGGAALADAVVRLDGLALTPRRSAALISINGKPAQWLERGSTIEGVTLQEVRSDKIVIDTATGPREVSLADKPGGEAKAAAGASGDTPPGFRLPPPPASAPGSRR
jgi:hypothetical protein